MINLPTQFLSYSSILIIFALFQASLIFTLIYLFITKVLSSKHENIDHGVIKQEAYDRALKILDESKEEALKVLTSAQEKARKVIENTEFLNQSTQQTMKSEVEKLSQKQITAMQEISKEIVDEYRDAVTKEKEQGITEIKGATEMIKNKMSQEMDEFEKALEKSTLESEEEVRSKIMQEYQQAKIEIDEYKKQRISEIDKKVTEALPQIAKEILGKSMTVDDHESAVMTALETAKREKAFEV